jgi:hypothetical protein
MATKIGRAGAFPPPSLPRGSEHISARLIIAAGLIAVLTGFAVLTLTKSRADGSAAAPFPRSEAVLYAQFGTKADAVISASSDGSHKRKLFVVPHAAEYGIVPALSPDSRALAFTLLPPTNLAPAPDSPAELWVAALDGSAPRLLGGGFDLLVHPLWTPAGDAVLARRLLPDGRFALQRVGVSDGAIDNLVVAEAALFPVGFDSNGRLLYIAISSNGCDLSMLDSSGPVTLAHLSDGLTRDWTLSPDRGRLAFVALAPSQTQMTSRVAVLDLSSRAITPVSAEGSTFGPAWSADGSLSFARVGAGAGSIITGSATYATSRAGFDAPLAWSRSAGLAVRSFEAPSLTQPGRQSLAVIAPPGSRHTIAHGEVTFIGWTYR